MLTKLFQTESETNGKHIARETQPVDDGGLQTTIVHQNRNCCAEHHHDCQRVPAFLTMPYIVWLLCGIVVSLMAVAMLLCAYVDSRLDSTRLDVRQMVVDEIMRQSGLVDAPEMDAYLSWRRSRRAIADGM